MMINMDTIYHAAVGFIVSGIIILLFAKRNRETDLRPNWPMAVSAIAPLLLGLAKEAYDKWFGPGTPELADVTATWSGGLAAMFLILFIDTFRTDKY